MCAVAANSTKNGLSNWFGVERKVKISLTVAAFSVLLVLSLSYVGVMRFREDAWWVTHTREVLEANESLLSSMSEAVGEQRGYLFTGKEMYLAQYLAARERVQTALTRLRELTKDNAEQQNRIDALESEVNARMEGLKNAITLRESEGLVAAQASAQQGDGEAQDQRIRTIVAGIKEGENSLLKARETAAAASGGAIRAALVMAGLLLMVLFGLAWFAIGRDFTGARRAEQEVRDARSALEEKVAERTQELERVAQAASKLAAIVEWSDDAIISKTVDGIITSWNPGAERMLGYKAGEIVGQPMLRLFPRDRLDEERVILERIRRGERVGSYDSKRMRRDGSVVDVSVSVSPVRDEIGKILGVSTIARDVTEKKKSEDDIRQQASLLNLAPVTVFSLEGEILMWTRGAERLYGFSEAEAVGKNVRELLNTEFAKSFEAIREHLSEKGTWEGELAHWTKDKNRVVVASQWVLYQGKHEGASRILDFSADLTALKRAEALQVRSQKLEALGTLAGGIAHDFNNVLGVILGSASLAEAELPATSGAAVRVKEISKAAWRAADLVQRILSFSRPQEQKLEIQPLESVVTDSLKMIRATLPAAVEIRTEFAPNLPMAKVDATQVYQVIVNLATNAAHAIGESQGLGIIEIKVDAPVVDDQEITPSRELAGGRYVRLRVSDNGCGMSSRTLERIFDPFFTTKPTGKGTGLGLSVVHRIVASHDGVLRVYSEPGKGTSFHIYFPAAEQEAKLATGEKGTVAAGRGEWILFVDDEPLLVSTGRLMLEKHGYQVTGVTSAEEALGQFRAKPDLYGAVVTDLSMPVMSGLVLARELRAIRPDVPVVLASGYVPPEEQEKAARLGIHDIVTKPVNLRELLAVLARVLGETGEKYRRESA